MPTTLYVDNSTLKSVATCDLQAAIHYALGYVTVEERPALRAGTAIHEALAAHLRGASVDEALAAFDASYGEWAASVVPSADRLGYDNVRAVLRAVLVARPLPTLPFVVEPRLVEVGAQATLTYPGICLCGHPDVAHETTGEVAPCSMCPCVDLCAVVLRARLDAAVQMRTGEWAVLDWKSTGQMTPLWLERFQFDSQLTGYPWLLSQHLGKPVSTAIVGAIEVGVVPTSDRPCKRHATRYAECGPLHVQHELVVTQRTPEQTAEWRRTALALARQFRRLRLAVPTLDDVGRVRQTGVFSGACPTCDYKRWCRSGLDATLAHAMLKYEPWVPFTPPTQEAQS